MRDVLDVQRDHPALVRHCMRLLAPGGLLLFSNNLRSFRLDGDLQREFRVEDWQRPSLDPISSAIRAYTTASWCITADLIATGLSRSGCPSAGPLAAGTEGGLSRDRRMGHTRRGKEEACTCWTSTAGATWAAWKPCAVTRSSWLTAVVPIGRRYCCCTATPPVPGIGCRCGRTLPATTDWWRWIFLGFGFSDKPLHHTYSIMEQADIAEAVVGKLGLGRFHVLAA